MNRLARPISLLSVLLVCLAVTTVAGRAGEEPAVVRALLDSAALSTDVRPTYASIDVAADGTIMLSDYQATYRADSDDDTAATYRVEALVLAGVSDIGAGVFEVASAEWQRTTMTTGGEAVAAIPLITAASLYIRQPGKAPTGLERIRASNVLAREIAIPEALVMVDGHAIMLEDLSGTWDGDPMTGAGTSQFAANRIHVPGAVFDGDENLLAMAGYSELELAVSGTSTTIYSEDAVDFDLEMRLEGRDVGRLIIELGADGIPLSLFTAIDATEPDTDALLPFADGVSLKRARIRFEDESLTSRVLALMAEAEDTDVASFVAEGTQGLDMILKGVLTPELARQVSAALTTYLNDPDSITFALAPEQPVRLDAVLAGLQNPMALIKLLQMSVTAND